MIIAVSQRIDFHEGKNERRDALDQRLVEFLYQTRHIITPIPNGLSTKGKLSEWLGAISPKGIVLSGGNNIGDCLDRDLTENKVLEYAIRNKLPVLGICRGMQMLGHYFGAEIKTVHGHVNIRHQLNGVIGGEVNSFHNQSLSSIPKEFNVLARSFDGEIEAIRHHVFPFEGWMWHPEREKIFNDRDVTRLLEIFT
jgi:gamma-glutamyl-gamma-aminobutyrate hydrolase PuuD